MNCKPDSDYLRKLVLVAERINEAMEQLTDLYPCKDEFVRNRVKSVTEITLGEAFCMASFCADSFADSLNAKQAVGDVATETITKTP